MNRYRIVVTPGVPNPNYCIMEYVRVWWKLFLGKGWQPHYDYLGLGWNHLEFSSYYEAVYHICTLAILGDISVVEIDGKVVDPLILRKSIST